MSIFIPHMEQQSETVNEKWACCRSAKVQRLWRLRKQGFEGETYLCYCLTCCGYYFFSVSPAGTLYSSCVRSVMMLVCQFVRIHSSSGLWVVWTMWSLSWGSWNRTGWTSSYSWSYCHGRHPSMVRYTFTCNSWRVCEHFSDDKSAQPQTSWHWLVLKYVCTHVYYDRIFQCQDVCGWACPCDKNASAILSHASDVSFAILCLLCSCWLHEFLLLLQCICSDICTCTCDHCFSHDYRL